MKTKTGKETPIKSGSKKSTLRENIEALVIAIILALFIRAFGVQAFKIPTGSMKETLLVGDYILVNKFIYGIKIPFTDMTIIPIKEPKREDIVVFKFPRDPSKDYIKRVIGIAGDKIEIRSKKLYVNNELQEHEFAVFKDVEQVFSGIDKPRDNFGPVTVPEGKLFVMGDNRDESFDSRFWGFVDLSALRGKAFMIYWSWDKQKFGLRWDRLGHLIK